MILRIMARLLPVGALFLPLGVLNIRILFSDSETRLNIVELFRMLGDMGENELMLKVFQSEMFDAARPWLYAAIAGLAIGVLAILAGIAIAFPKGKTPLAAAMGVYGGGTLGAILMAVSFGAFGSALGDSLLFKVNASVSWGAWVLLALLALNAGLAWWQRGGES